MISPESALLLIELLEDRSVPVTHPNAVATVTVAAQAYSELQAIVDDDHAAAAAAGGDEA